MGSTYAISPVHLAICFKVGVIEKFFRMVDIVGFI